MIITLSRTEGHAPGRRDWTDYQYAFSEDVTMRSGHVYRANVPVGYGSDLAECRRMLRRYHPDAQIVLAWNVPS